MTVETLCDKRVYIQQDKGTADGEGNTPESWTTKYSDVAARIRPTSARERQAWGGLPTVASHVIYVADASLTLLEKDRIFWDGRVFNVLGVRNPDEQGEYLIVDAEEIR